MSGTNFQHCDGWWSPIAAAGPLSALPGVLAGFVFAGVVVVLSTTPNSRPSSPHGENEIHRSYALQFLTAAFIVFALDSYFSAITAGELACNRAGAQTLLTGGMLGTGAIMTVVGLGWLILAYANNTQEIRILLGFIIVGIWALVIILLALSGMEEGQDLVQGHFPDIAPYVISLVVGITVVTLARKSKPLADDELQLSVLRAAIAALCAAIVAAVATAIAASGSPQWWQQPPWWAGDFIISLSLLVPEAALIASVIPAIESLRASKYESAAGEASPSSLSWAYVRRLFGIRPRQSTMSAVADEGATSAD
jgi:hypothetical protein